MKMGIERVIILTLVASTLISMACAIPGSASFYTGPYTPSACFGNIDQGTMIAAANPGLYNNGAGCGRRFTVRCTGPALRCRNRAFITVTIVESCPGCEPDQINLSREAFSMIANPDGTMQIDYNPA